LPRQSKRKVPAATPLRSIPAVGAVLDRPRFLELSRRFGHALVADLLRERFAALRQGFEAEEIREEALASRVEDVTPGA